jgi:hypothetical protein
VRKLIVIFIACLTFVSAYSQKLANELGGWIGPSYYIGDLNPYKHYHQSHLAGGLLYRKNINKRIALRLGISYGKITGADSLSKIEANVNRNLSFRSRIIEIGPIVEINFFDYEAGRKNGRHYYKNFISPYLFIGLTYFKMNPQAVFTDDFIDLQALGTEGQGSALSDRKKYSLNQISIPLGFGCKVSVTSRLNISLEYGIRKTFTDYLDDVSGKYVDPFALEELNGPLAANYADQSLNQEGINASNEGTMRGNPKNKDWYSFSGIVVTFCLGRTDACKGIFK